MVNNPMQLAQGMCDEILAVIYKYAEAMPVVSAIGVLEVVKQQLIVDHVEASDEDD